MTALLKTAGAAALLAIAGCASTASRATTR
jgi:hypothetical protein